MVEYCRVLREPKGEVMAKGLHSPTRDAVDVPDVIDVDWGACENDVAERSICAPAMGIDSDALIVESCLTPAATGFRPRACHWDRMTVDMVGHRSKVTEAMFCTAPAACKARSGD